MAIGNVVALVDGSVYAQSVCDHAAWVSERLAVPVELVHVFDRSEDTAVTLTGVGTGIVIGRNGIEIETVGPVGKQIGMQFLDAFIENGNAHGG